MLSDSIVLNYIREGCMAPFQYITKTDVEILKYVKDYTLRRTFSRYIPEKKEVHIDPSDATQVVPNKVGHFYIKDPDDMGILTVIELYLPNIDIILKAPAVDAFSFDELEGKMMGWFQAAATKPYSVYNYTWEFMHPNIIRVSPTPGMFDVRYERQHVSFASVPTQWEDDFLRLALGDVKIWIAGIRSRFTNMTTPFGEMGLNATELKTEGTELRNEVITRLETLPMNTILEFI